MDIRTPIVFDDGQPAGRGDINQQQQGNAYYPQVGAPGFNMNMNQTDPYSRYYGKLWYDIKKMEIELNKQELSNNKRIELQENLNKKRLEYSNYIQLLSLEVIRDSEGQLFIVFIGPDKRQLTGRRLVAQKNYYAVQYETSYPTHKEVLDISWGEQSETHVRFLTSDAYIDESEFYKKVTSRGLMLTVSGRTKKRAAAALLAYSVCNAEIKEIPGMHGWNLIDNKWHYAKDEITMEGLLADE